MAASAVTRDHWIRLMLLSIGLVIGYHGILVPLGVVTNVQLTTQDQLVRWRHRRQPPPAAAKDLVLVIVDDASLDAVGRQWPWNRAVFARLLQAIAAGHPRAIACDLVFTGSSAPDADAALAEAIRQHAPVFLAAYLDPQGALVQPEHTFLDAGGVAGLINKPRDPDLTVRRLWAVVMLPGMTPEPSYALEVHVAAAALGQGSSQISTTPTTLTISSGDNRPVRVIPLRRQLMGINALTTLADLRHVSCVDVLAGRVPSETFTGATVLIGTDAEITHDVYPTPLGLLPGVVLNANGLLTILSDRPVRPVPAWAVWGLGFLVAVGASAAALFLPIPLSLMVIGGIAAAAVGLSCWAVWHDIFTDWFTPVALAAAAWLAGALYQHLWLLERALAKLRTAQQETQDAFFATAKVLIRALEMKDPYTAGHSERVAQYATRLAERLHLSRGQIEEIHDAALLHDIGKIGLPEEVLHKTGPLTDDERTALRHHHADGSHILEPLAQFTRIIPMVYAHHERYDGKGFPHGLAGDLIPLGAQIIAVVDAFDAMTTNRGYNVPKTVAQAVEELQRCAGSQFNPAFVEAFVQMIRDEGPLGS